jgi:hypothetical protein
MSVDYSPEAIGQRLRAMSAQADLRPERRLECKVSYTAEAVTQRLRQQSMLRRACLEFALLGKPR